MRILLLNWRDIKNPSAGGAEINTYETLRHLAKTHEVWQFSSAFPGCKKEERYDGINVIRRGNFLTVYFWAFWEYFRRFRGKVDIVVDECNTLPFFTPMYVKGKKIFFIHQMAREFWDLEVAFPFSKIGKMLEPFFIRMYRKTKTITVTESFKKELEEMGFFDVGVVLSGSSIKPLEKMPPKQKEPLVVFLGRLKRAKKPDDALAAMKKIHEKIPSMQGIIMGEGYLREEIGKNAPEYVQVLGKVAQQRKVEILKSASLLLVPGVREGWGLVVIEANSFGTPCVGYGIDGLRDSIVDGKTGVLVECNPDAMADAAVKMLQDGKRRRELGENCLEWSRNFSWEKSAKGFQKIIEAPF
ncbi:glycosyltransferase family 4 protein [Candidatus Micrarchaeota archaeon]|nr:glycosyltransferase family 4 protein [Candidatus Micrarchaeota archaeon]